jgi:hypothetical protein
VADRPYGEFYGFYTVGPEYFGYRLVLSYTFVYLLVLISDISCCGDAHCTAIMCRIEYV